MSGPTKTCVLLLVVTAVLALSPMAAGSDVSFNRDIRPLLAENCFQCHGPDPAPREADLRLDLRSGAIAKRDGSAAVVPGDADASELIARITSDDPDVRMPPAETGKRLTPEQIDLLRRWIDFGAEYQRHWAFEPIVGKASSLPSRGAAEQLKPSLRANNPIDRFILAKLHEQGLSPSPQADCYTLIRRLYLDLLGLLPSIAEADAFARDDRPNAYQRLVDRVLSSPRFGGDRKSRPKSNGE